MLLSYYFSSGGLTSLKIKYMRLAEANWNPTALTYVENVKTPLLMMAGEYDLRCPVSQSDQLFYALKRLGKEVEYIRFAGENYMLTKASNREYRTGWTFSNLTYMAWSPGTNYRPQATQADPARAQNSLNI